MRSSKGTAQFLLLALIVLAALAYLAGRDADKEDQRIRRQAQQASRPAPSNSHYGND